jgi:hypothetical protein
MEAIQGFSLNAIPAQEYNTSIAIPVTWEMSFGINVTVNVTYNAAQCCSVGPLTAIVGQCDCLISNPDLFYPDGLVITATASNRISGPEEQSTDVKVIISLYM